MKPARTARLPRRRVDRIEDAAAWLVATLALLLLVAAMLVGNAVHAAARGPAVQDRRQVDATLLQDVPPLVTPGRGLPVALVRAGWVSPAGPRTGTIVVTGAARAGTVRQIWVDRSGTPVPAPATAVDAAVAAAVTGAGVLVGGWVALAGLWCAVRAWTMRLADAAWTREWAAVEPGWSERGRA